MQLEQWNNKQIKFGHKCCFQNIKILVVLIWWILKATCAFFLCGVLNSCDNLIRWVITRDWQIGCWCRWQAEWTTAVPNIELNHWSFVLEYEFQSSIVIKIFFYSYYRENTGEKDGTSSRKWKCCCTNWQKTGTPNIAVLDRFMYQRELCRYSIAVEDPIQSWKFFDKTPSVVIIHGRSIPKGLFLDEGHGKISQQLTELQATIP